MADNNTRIAEIERDAAVKVAVGEAARRDAAESAALDAQIRAEDSERAARSLSASAGAANEAADNANKNSFSTGIIALIAIIGLVIGGAWLYNGYAQKNDQLYNATVNNDHARMENRVLSDENARNAARPAPVTVISDPTADLRRAEEAARPTPAPTPVPEPKVIVVPAEATPAPAATPSAEGTTTVESTTTTTTTTTPSNADSSSSGGN